MKYLKPIILKNNIADKISKDIMLYLKDTFFLKIKDIYKQIFKENIKFNSIDDDFIKAVKTYKIQIHNNKIRGKFNSKLTKYIKEKLKGKWNNKGKYYEVNKIPQQAKDFIAQKKERISNFNEKINNFLNDYKSNLENSINNIDIDYSNVLYDAEEQFKKNMFTVKPTITKYNQEQLNNEYIESSKLSIKNWQEDNIIKLRKDIQEQVLNQGYSNKSIAEYIEKVYNTTHKKANRLARDESRLILTKYSNNRYIENGIYKYKWITMGDDNVREDHKKLNGKIFDFRDPPIIDSRTGQRGNPSESYGCRCFAIPIIN